MEEQDQLNLRAKPAEVISMESSQEMAAIPPAKQASVNIHIINNSNGKFKLAFVDLDVECFGAAKYFKKLQPRHAIRLENGKVDLENLLSQKALLIMHRKQYFRAFVDKDLAFLRLQRLLKAEWTKKVQTPNKITKTKEIWWYIDSSDDESQISCQWNKANKNTILEITPELEIEEI